MQEVDTTNRLETTCIVFQICFNTLAIGVVRVFGKTIGVACFNCKVDLKTQVSSLFDIGYSTCGFPVCHLLKSNEGNKQSGLHVVHCVKGNKCVMCIVNML